MPGTAVCDETAPSQLQTTAAGRRISSSSLQAKPVKNYLFADNIRFLSIAGVVLIHSIQMSFMLAGLPSGSLLERCFVQPFKFATIGFFLISGFLMGHGLRSRTPLEYLKRRVQRVFVPWAFWVSLFTAMMLFHFSGQSQFHSSSLWNGILYAFSVLYGCVFQTAFWFVPNLMIALCLLFHFRRHLYDLRLGCVLMGLSLFYGLNMYTHWIPGKNHTEAMFGFIFYLWLGVWAERNFTPLQARMSRISTPFMFSLAGLLGVAALIEANVLSAAGDPYATSSLRISNQLFSMAAALALFKLRKPVWPRALNVRATTFGIYLIHMIVFLLLLDLVVGKIFGGTIAPVAGSRAFTAVSLSLFFFVGVYGGALALTDWVLHYPRLRWMIGASR